MIGDKPPSDDFIEIPLSKDEYKAYLNLAYQFISSGKPLDQAPEIVREILIATIPLISSGMDNFCKCFKLYPNEGGRPETAHLKGGAFIIMALLDKGFPIKPDSVINYGAYLGFKTMDGENVPRQLYLIKDSFFKQLNIQKTDPQWLKLQRVNVALFDSINYFKSQNTIFENAYQQQQYDNFHKKIINLKPNEIKLLSERIISDQNLFEVLITK